MSDLYWLTDVQMARLVPYFPGAMAGRGLTIIRTWPELRRPVRNRSPLKYLR